MSVQDGIKSQSLKIIALSYERNVVNVGERFAFRCDGVSHASARVVKIEDSFRQLLNSSTKHN